MSQLSKSNKMEDIFSILSAKPYISFDHNVQINVWPEFIDNKSSNSGDIFIWAYHIRIENKNNDNIKLLSRYWKIFDEKGDMQEVKGDGVIGEQPIIAPNSNYQYSSGVHLKYPSGIMTGKYIMKKMNDDSIFEVKIPTFSLDVPGSESIIN